MAIILRGWFRVLVDVVLPSLRCTKQSCNYADCFVPTNEQRSKRRRSCELRRLWARPFIDSFIKPIGLLVSRNDGKTIPICALTHRFYQSHNTHND